MKKHDNTDQDSDDRTRETQPTLATALGLNPIEVAILDVSRCLCYGWASGNVDAWSRAFDFAEERLGPVDGPAFVARVIAFMRAILRGRSSAFSCMPVGCRHISKDEQIMMTVVRSTFRGDNEDLIAALGRLVTTQSPASALLTAHELHALCLRYEALVPEETTRMAPTNRTLN